MTKLCITLIVCLLIVSCQNDTEVANQTNGKYHIPESALAFEDEFQAAHTSTPPPPPPEFTLEKGSKIIKNGFMEFEVDNLALAKNEIDKLVDKCDGLYDNESYDSYGNRISYSLQIRIPNTKFDSIVFALESGVGELKTKNINARDVTEEYVDLKIRLENNLAYLKQYTEILEKAKTIKDVLEVQEKIRRIEEEIDSKKGRLKFLDYQVKYSTLQLEINELITSSISNKQKFGRRVINAFNNGVQGFLSFIVGVIYLWPFLLVGLLLFFSRKSILKKIKKTKSSTNEN